MDNYKKMYCILFNKITDIINELQSIQKQAEEMYIYGEGQRFRIVELEQKEDEK